MKDISSVNPGTNTVLIMTSSTRTSILLSEFLSSVNPDAPPGLQGRKMMERKLRHYLWWKGKLSERKQEGRSHFALPDAVRAPNDGYQKLYGDGDNVSEALKKKDKERAQRNASRRRVRGGVPASVASGNGNARSVKTESMDLIIGEDEMRGEADRIAEL